MINTWQDFDENSPQTWGLWFATCSEDGHVVAVAGPYLTMQEAVHNLPI